MELTDYRALVAELEATARRDPGALRRRVYGLIALGYGYVFFILVALGGITAALVAFMVWTGRVAALWKLVVALLVVTGVVLKALWVRVEPPTGRRLRRDEAPKLFARVEAIRQALRAPRPAVVLLTSEFNASVASIPQLGILGFPRAYLSVGLPLMYALTPEQFDAVLAHEFGHLSGAHPKHGLWVHRVGRTWQHLKDEMERRKSLGAILFDRFFGWFIPRLNAYGYVMSRADEYAADADAARVIGAPAMGGALVALAARGGALLDEYWSDLWSRADHEPALPSAAWNALPMVMRSPEQAARRHDRVATALAAAPGDTDTHPPTRERLRALGLLSDDTDAVALTDTLLAPLHTTAAAEYMGELATAELASLDRAWHADAGPEWRKRFARGEARRASIAELSTKDAAGQCTLDELVTLMWQVAEESGDAAAVALARRLAASHEALPQPHFLLGRALLAADDPAGVGHAERAMDLDREAVMPAAQLLYAYYDRRGDTAGMATAESRFNAERDARAEAREERLHVRPADTFMHPALDPTIERAIRDGMRRTSGIKAVVVTRKRVRHDPESPLLVLVCERSWRSWFRDDEERGLGREFLDHITADEFPAVIALASGSKEQKQLAADLLARGEAVRITP